MTRFFPTFVVLCLLLLARQGLASGWVVHRVLLEKLSCDTARDVVEDSGSVVFRFQKDRLSRVVKDRSYCDHDQALRRFDFDVKDTRGCHVGYTCEIRDGGF